MASVAAKFTFSCPHCDKVLKTGARPAAGKKIKCPACGEPFVPDLDDAEESGIQEKPTLKGKSKAASKTSMNGKVRPTPKKPAQKSGGSGMLLGVLGCGALVLLLGCGGGAFGVTGWLWPGFMRSKPADETKLAGAKDDSPKDGEKGGGQPAKSGNDIANFVQADANLLIGLNIKSLREKNQFDPVMKQLEDANGAALPAEYKDFFRNSDMVLLSIVQGDPQAFKKDKGVFAVLAATPEAAAKVKALPVMGEGELLAGKHHIYRPGKKQLGYPERVTVIGDRLFIATTDGWTDGEFIAFLDKSLKGENAQNAVSKQGNYVNLTDFWMAMPMDEAKRKELKDDEKELPPEYRQFAPALQAMQRSKGVSFGIKCLDANFWKAHVYVDCANAGDAVVLKNAGVDLHAFGVNLLKTGLIKGIPASLEPDLNSFSAKADDTLASANVLLSTQSITGLAKLATAREEKIVKNDPPPFKEKDPPFKDPFKDPPFKDPFKEKDPPFKEKDPPKSKLMNPPGPLSPQFYTLGLNGGSTDERGIQLKKGQRVLVQVANNTPRPKKVTQPANNVDYYIFRGDTSTDKNIIKSDVKPIDKDRSSPISSVVIDVPNSGDDYQTYYIRVVGTGPGRSTQIIVSITDWTGKDDPMVATKDPPAKEKDPPKINVNAIKPPFQYPIPNMVNGHTNEKLFVFQPGKMVQVNVQFAVLGKQRADVHITILKGDKGNDVVAQRSGFGSFAVQFVPAGDVEAVYRIRIHNRGPNTAQNCGAQVGQQQ